VAEGSDGARRSIAEGIDTGAREGGGTAGRARKERRRMLMVGAAGLMIVAAVVFTVVQVFRHSGDVGDDSRRRVAIDSVTGEVFTSFAIRDGDSQPWKNPKTGKSTVYQAEACFWTREGGAKTEPTYVLLNSLVGKDGPTICPDCWHEVVAHNPMPPMELLNAALKAKKSGGK
jgi:hypothetical protein